MGVLVIGLISENILGNKFFLEIPYSSLEFDKIESNIELDIEITAIRSIVFLKFCPKSVNAVSDMGELETVIFLNPKIDNVDIDTKT